MPTVITIQRLADFLFAAGVDIGRFPPRLRDSDWALVDREWMRTTGAADLVDTCARDVGQYVAEESDCDDFASCSAERMRKLHRRTKDRPPKCGIAFGEADYVRRQDGVPHAINAFVSSPDAGKTLELTFYEPQTGHFIHLTQKEIATCIVYF